jgi:tetratricopeptide (TPR) repeat protein
MTPSVTIAEPLSERLRALRERAGLTRTALAEPRFTVSYVSQIEAGKKTPSPDAIAYFAQRLGASEGYLTTGVPDGIEGEIGYEIERARLASAQGRLAESLDIAREQAGRADAYGLARLRTQALIVSANAQFMLGRYREAIDRYEEALEDETLGERERGMVTNALATAYRTVGDLAYAVDVVESFLRAQREDPLDAAVAAELNTTLVSIYFERGDILRAEQAAERAIATTEAGVSPLARANALWTTSRVLAERHRYSEALELATRARIILEELGDRRRIVRVHGAYAFLCLEADPPRLEAADDHLRTAESLLDEYSLDEDRAYLFAERSRLALLQGRPAEALDLASRALELTGPDALERGRCLFLQGRGFVLSGRPAEGLGCFREAASVFEKHGARQQQASSWREIGEIQLAEGETAAALESLRAGLEALDPKRSRA